MNIKSYISKLVNECIHANQEENLRESIRPMVAKALMESMYEKKDDDKRDEDEIEATVEKLMQDPEFKEKAIEYLDDEDAFKSWSDSFDKKTYDKLDNMSDGAKRRIISQLLQDEKINHAPIAYALWPSMSEDAARSWFAKKVNGTNGEEFTDEEYAQIYNLLHNRL